MISTNLAAWVYNEHEYIGMSAFRDACGLLNRSKPHKENYLVKLACRNAEYRARLFGMHAALSGDHVKKPEDFSSVYGERQALSFRNYAFLALQNTDHFWPESKRIWKEYFLQSLDIASKARTLMLEGNTLQGLAEFDVALIYLAYSSHFLQDSFSAGHMGFSRANSLQGASLIYHDAINKEGRYVRSLKLHPDLFDLKSSDKMRKRIETKEENPCVAWYGEDDEQGCMFESWRAYGDGELLEEKNDDNKEIIMRTQIAAIHAVILKFSLGNDQEYSALVDAQFPFSASVKEHSSTWIGNPGEEEEFRNKCGPEVEYKEQLCWFDIDSSYTEPVYPDWEIGISQKWIPDRNSLFYTFDISYSLFFEEIEFFRKHIPNSLRIYYSMSFKQPDFNYDGFDVSRYNEIGLNLTLPNLYQSLPISHSADLAGVTLSDDPESWYKSVDDTESGMYMGLNTNIDLLKARITFGAGVIMFNRDIDDCLLVASLKLAYGLGSIGGGPIQRWYD